MEIPYVARRRIEKPVFGFAIKTANGMYVYGSNTQLARYDLPYVEGAGTVKLDLAPLRQGAKMVAAIAAAFRADAPPRR